jgi:hypothetical protein
MILYQLQQLIFSEEWYDSMIIRLCFSILSHCVYFAHVFTSSRIQLTLKILKFKFKIFKII